MKNRTTLGVLAGLTAPCLFAGLYLLTAPLKPFTAEEIVGLRYVSLALLLAPVLVLTGRWPQVRGILRRLRSEPVLLPVLLVCAAIMGFQLWLFMWGPMHGQGLAVSLGYLLMPLVMVLVGRLVFGERLVGLRRVAVLCAVVGVVVQLVGGGLSWATPAVALVYPVYFALRRRYRLDVMPVFWLETVLLTPLGLVLVLTGDGPAVLRENLDTLLWPVVVLALGSALAMMLYISASGILSIGVFGLLGYLEPVLLVVASVLLGERLTTADVLSYLPIGLALLLLGLDTLRRSRGLPQGPGRRAPE